jgi:hypothetical protein
MSATTAQLANLRNIRIAIVHAADVMESLIIDHSGKLTEDEASAMYLDMRKVYDKLDDVVDTLLVVEERDEG